MRSLGEKVPGRKGVFKYKDTYRVIDTIGKGRQKTLCGFPTPCIAHMMHDKLVDKHKLKCVCGIELELDPKFRKRKYCDDCREKYKKETVRRAGIKFRARYGSTSGTSHNYVREVKDNYEKNLDTKPRVCLKCDTTFQSEGPTNRICHFCRCENFHVSDRIAAKIGNPHVMCDNKKLLYF